MQNRILVSATLFCALTLSGCAAIAVTDAAVGTTVFAGKTAVKGTVGAGKLVVRGTGAAVRGTARAVNGPPETD